MRLWLAAGFAALLLCLAPQAALAHGDEPHAGEAAGKVHVASHPCPGGSGECCCAKPLAPPAKPPAAAPAAVRFVLLPATAASVAPPLAQFSSPPQFLVRARAPPPGR